MCRIQNSKPNPKHKATTIENHTNPSDMSGLGHVFRVNAVISWKIRPKPRECVKNRDIPIIQKWIFPREPYRWMQVKGRDDFYMGGRGERRQGRDSLAAGAILDGARRDESRSRGQFGRGTIVRTSAMAVPGRRSERARRPIDGQGPRSLTAAENA